MLVEDDNNLREIYGARLLAEGYEIVSAKDGEEALALAVKEKPDLIISDIMMPKISGFDMLDILRSTTETKHTKVIMMTALSQAEDKDRADKLGADRYLVKSQVTLEDVAKAAAEVLGESAVAPPASNLESTPSPTPAEPAPVAQTPAEPAPVAQTPTTPSPAPADPVTLANNLQALANAVAAVSGAVNASATPAPAPAPAPSPAPADPALNTTAMPVAAPPTTTTQTPVEPAPVAQTPADTTTTPATSTGQTSVHTKVIAPINNLTSSPPDLQALLAREEVSQSIDTSTSLNPTSTPVSTPLSTNIESVTVANPVVVSDVTPAPPSPIADPSSNSPSVSDGSINIGPDGTIQS
ncbi:response regulator, partial [Candidatus Saccharibacteria bacterium]|nr:response regulator [Candidatus Saccharibacteria bacterium]